MNKIHLSYPEISQIKDVCIYMNINKDEARTATEMKTRLFPLEHVFATLLLNDDDVCFRLDLI